MLISIETHKFDTEEKNQLIKHKIIFINIQHLIDADFKFLFEIYTCYCSLNNEHINT